MKILMIQVGNPVKEKIGFPDEKYIQRKSLVDGKLRYYLKQNIINADSQMQSILDQGVQVEYGHFSGRKSIGSLIKIGLRIRRLSKKKDIDLVHVFWGSSTAIFTLIFSAKPVVISFCGSDLLGSKDSSGKLTLGGRISRLLSQISAVGSHANIVKAEKMVSQLWSFSRKKTFVIPNGVDLKSFYPISKDVSQAYINFDSQKKYILFFSSNGQHVKNIKLAEKVYSIVKQSMAETEFIHAFNISQERLLYYYNSCDVMLLTSFHEGSNNSIKEARACNLPIVSVDVGDIKERLNQVKNCFVLKNWDAEKLAEKILYIFNKGERSNGSAYSGDVDLNLIAKRIIDVYKGILNKA
jgi:glycosyltransferase involved in cell wall biosynthesis